MLFVAIASYLAYRREVDYKGLNKAITLAIYHQSRMQGASMTSQKPKHHAYTNDYRFNPRATRIKALKKS